MDAGFHINAIFSYALIFLSSVPAHSFVRFPYGVTLIVLAVYEGTGWLQEAVLLLCISTMQMKLNLYFPLKFDIL